MGTGTNGTFDGYEGNLFWCLLDENAVDVAACNWVLLLALYENVSKLFPQG